MCIMDTLDTYLATTWSSLKKWVHSLAAQTFILRSQILKFIFFQMISDVDNI